METALQKVADAIRLVVYSIKDANTHRAPPEPKPADPVTPASPTPLSPTLLPLQVTPPEETDPVQVAKERERIVRIVKERQEKQKEQQSRSLSLSASQSEIEPAPKMTLQIPKLFEGSVPTTPRPFDAPLTPHSDSSKDIKSPETKKQAKEREKAERKAQKDAAKEAKEKEKADKKNKPSQRKETGVFPLSPRATRSDTNEELTLTNVPPKTVEQFHQIFSIFEDKFPKSFKKEWSSQSAEARKKTKEHMIEELKRLGFFEEVPPPTPAPVVEGKRRTHSSTKIYYQRRPDIPHKVDNVAAPSDTDTQIILQHNFYETSL